MNARAEPAQEGGDSNVLAMPRRPRRRLRGLSAALVAVVVVGAILAVLYLTPLLSVRTLSIEGTRLADKSKVTALLKPLLNTPLAKVSTEQVRALLEGEPAIQDVRLGLSGPDSLVVTIVEHREVAIRQQGENFYLVGDNGARLKKLDKRADRKLPVIKLGVPDKDGRIFDTVVHALAQLPADVLKQLDTAGAQSVDNVTFKLDDKRTVVWGDASEGALKAKVLQVMLGKNAVKDEVIDVSTPRVPLSSGGTESSNSSNQ